MRAHQQIPGLLAALIAMSATAQTPYPELTIQDVAWTEGTHHYAVSNSILSPGTPNLPATISGTADAEFVSASSVRLAPGFHAGGFSGGGRFRARLDQGVGQVADLIIMPQEPYSYIADNIVHVHKWEKLEVGLKLPQDYQDAVDRFFEHYYPNVADPYESAPSNTDPAHDLNPYADDSLQVVMTLSDPTGTTRLKWGFFMREAKWSSAAENARLVADTENPLFPYCIRFRMSPDVEGLWGFNITLKAPHTTTIGNVPLPDHISTGFQFQCLSPLADNKGPVEVHPANRRILKTSTGEPFIAMGTNMAVDRGGPSEIGLSDEEKSFFYKQDIDVMKETMGLLHDVGGNFLRIWLYYNLFSPEYVNLGVYDAYRIPRMCDLPEVENDTTCLHLMDSWVKGRTGNCQYQCWAFDRLLEQARESNIYLQVCVDPYPGVIDYEKFDWGAHSFVMHFLDKNRPAQGNPYDMKMLFYQDGDTSIRDIGVFSYWKRRYKYIMARWAYSPQFAIIEPFQEIDQMLSYNADTLGSSAPAPDCSAANSVPSRVLCRENRGVWTQDTALPNVINQWITDMSAYIRNAVVADNLTNSPLGEDTKLLLLSYAGGPGYASGDTATESNFYRPFTNENLDLMDVHAGFITNQLETPAVPDRHMNGNFTSTYGFWNRFPYPTAPLSRRKPFNHGECSHFTSVGWNHDIEYIFHNYDISFHNEIWASIFSGKFATGSSWVYDRVFWWPNAMPQPPSDFTDPQFLLNNPNGFSKMLGATNVLNIGGTPIAVPNRRVHHHFKPLAALLNNQNWLDLDFFHAPYTNHRVFADNDAHVIESYYLKSDDDSLAIGWVHNRNAWVKNSYYFRSNTNSQNFLDCSAPNTQIVSLTGFRPSTEYFISWFPTRMNTIVTPSDTALYSLANGDLLLDLSSAPLGGTLNNYLDTLHADYAFIITAEPFVKNRRPSITAEPLTDDWDFHIYPNPAHSAVQIELPDGNPVVITLYDAVGRKLMNTIGIQASIYTLNLAPLARGAYWIQITDGLDTKTKKLIIH